MKTIARSLSIVVCLRCFVSHLEFSIKLIKQARCDPRLEHEPSSEVYSSNFLLSCVRCFGTIESVQVEVGEEGTSGTVNTLAAVERLLIRIDVPVLGHPINVILTEHTHTQHMDIEKQNSVSDSGAENGRVENNEKLYYMCVCMCDD